MWERIPSSPSPAATRTKGAVDYPGRLLTADFFHSRNFSAEFETVRAAGTLRNVETSAYRNAVSHGMNNLGNPLSANIAETSATFGFTEGGGGGQR